MARPLRFLFELTLLSATISGARRISQLGLDSKKIPYVNENETVRGIADSYFKVGDWVIDQTVLQLKKAPEVFPQKK
ncbi:hypothetical protein BJ742DRAFT_765625 [Cladochytrium replicatum]|nr:hypothetical protein BJ742DRAFT_765625 [Cladochytrium replicatum]